MIAPVAPPAGRWLVTGAGGQLGHDLLDVLTGADVLGLTRAELSVSEPGAVRDAFERWAPDVVVNAAAYTAVDRAESEPAAAWAVNAEGPGSLAAACADSGALLVHVSTDYVFDGSAARPYEVDDPVRPAGEYGRSKAAGEERVLASGARAYVVRTAWVYGGHGQNFVKTMMRLARERETVDVVDDQHGSPTWSRDLARAIVELVRRAPEPGIYHATGSGRTTWYGMARAVFAELGLEPGRVRPTTTAELARPAPRPAFSVLSDQRWRSCGLPGLPHWRGALTEAFASGGWRG